MAANATRVRPQLVQVIRRWPSRRTGTKTERRPLVPLRRPLRSNALQARARASGGPGTEPSVRADAGGANFYAPLNARCHEGGEESSAADGPADGSSDGNVDGNSIGKRMRQISLVALYYSP